MVAVDTLPRQLEIRLALPAEEQRSVRLPGSLEECLQQPQGQDLALYLASALAKSLGAELQLKRQGAGLTFVLGWKGD